MREVLHSFLLGALVEGKRFCHVRWVMDDPAVAQRSGFREVCGRGIKPDCCFGREIFFRSEHRQGRR